MKWKKYNWTFLITWITVLIIGGFLWGKLIAWLIS
jgi:hypothetical protein